MAKSSTRAVQTPGDEPNPPTADESAATSGTTDPKPDAFQANAQQIGGEDEDRVARLEAQLAAVLEQNQNLAAAVQNLARQAPAAKIANDADLPDYPSPAELKDWYEQSDDIAPRLTKQGWLVHPKASARTDENQTSLLKQLVELIKKQD